MKYSFVNGIIVFSAFFSLLLLFGCSGSKPREGKDFEVDISGVKLELLWIGPGEFIMGSPADEIGRWDDEGQQTLVRLTKGYWLGKYPVTQGQWQALMGSSLADLQREAAAWWGDQAKAGGHKIDGRVIVDAQSSQQLADAFAKASVGTWGEGEEFPMCFVSWNDAMEFARRLTEQERRAGRLPEGYVYTLPSEAQWEYAARAGTTTRFYAGNNEGDLGRAGWFDGNSGESTQPVGQKQPNAWGLYDMHGNVWEWTRTWADEYPGGIVVDFEGPVSGSYRVCRGGGWNINAGRCRSAYRRSWGPDRTSSRLGFRLALSSVQ